jgi:hypothetical protein
MSDTVTSLTPLQKCGGKEYVWESWQIHGILIADEVKQPQRRHIIRKISAKGKIKRYLVDPASSHMLVLKIKPCMSKYKHVVL